MVCGTTCSENMNNMRWTMSDLRIANEAIGSSSPRTAHFWHLLTWILTSYHAIHSYSLDIYMIKSIFYCLIISNCFWQDQLQFVSIQSMFFHSASFSQGTRTQIRAPPMYDRSCPHPSRAQALKASPISASKRSRIASWIYDNLTLRFHPWRGKWSIDNHWNRWC